MKNNIAASVNEWFSNCTILAYFTITADHLWKVIWVRKSYKKVQNVMMEITFIHVYM